LRNDGRKNRHWNRNWRATSKMDALEATT